MRKHVKLLGLEFTEQQNERQNDNVKCCFELKRHLWLVSNGGTYKRTCCHCCWSISIREFNLFTEESSKTHAAYRCFIWKIWPTQLGTKLTMANHIWKSIFLQSSTNLPNNHTLTKQTLLHEANSLDHTFDVSPTPPPLLAAPFFFLTLRLKNKK